MHAPFLLRILCLITLAVGLAAVDGGTTGNLLENPSFELGTGGTSHGDFTTLGWVGHNNAYTWAGINSDGGSQGSSYAHISFDGSIETATASRPLVTPGLIYEVAFDVRTTCLRLIEQRLLPHQFKVVSVPDYRATARAIKDMVVRGAGAIGATAAYGLAQGARGVSRTGLDKISAPR